jgi:hypothetical protein
VQGAHGEGRLLHNGVAGLRSRWAFTKDLARSTYVIGLYLEARSADPVAIIERERVKRLDLTLLVAAREVVEEIAEAIERALPSPGPALRADVATFRRLLSGEEHTGRMSFVYVPGSGTELWTRSGRKGVIPGPAFGRALFSVWLGSNPVQPSIKTDLLRPRP